MTQAVAPERAAVPTGHRMLPALLVVLTIFGPISMDLYLPVLPALTTELKAVTSAAQLTMTACLIGLGAGQLIAGPLSDRYGRRHLLLIGIGGYVVTSLLCAVAPTIEILIAVRLLQGFAGGMGIVIGSAAGRDTYSGRALIRFYGRLAVMGPTAAIVGPLLGGQLARFTDWRGLFVFLAAVGVALFAVAWFVFGETLPVERRTAGGFAATRRDLGVLIRDRVYVGAILNQGFVLAALFAYLAGATYILQGGYGLSPQQYSLAFGANSCGSVICGFLGARLSERWSLRGTLRTGLTVAGLGATGLLVAGIIGTGVWPVLASLFVLASGGALTSTPATTLALAEYPQMAGSASSLLGVVRYGFGGIAAPLVGITGTSTVLSLGIVATCCIALAMLAIGVLVGRHGRSAPGTAADSATADPRASRAD